jgi:hypothetical protein
MSLLKKIKLSNDWRAMLGFWALLVRIVFREPHPATARPNPDVITLCSRSRP